MPIKYKALIIGCGNMGCLNDAPGSGKEEKTISFAKALKESGRFDVYYYDEDGSKINKAIELWGGNWCNNARMDVVIVCTPDKTHYDILSKEIWAQPKLVIVEKPLCETVAEAEEIVDMYEKAGVPILLDYTRRFIPEYRDLIGKVGAVTCDFNRGKLHTLTHALDLITMYGTSDNVCASGFCEIMDEHRVWDLILYDDNNECIFREQRIGGEPVHPRYDHHTRYVIKNALEYLDEGKPLLCTMYDGLEALKLLEELC